MTATGSAAVWMMSSTAPSSSIRIPAGTISPSARRIFVSIDGRIEMLDLATGRVLATLDSDAEPIACDDDCVVAVRRPAPGDAGSVCLLGHGASTLDRRARLDLLTSDEMDHAVAFLDCVEVGAELDDTTAQVVVDVHNRYRGGAPPDDELLDQSNFVHRTTVTLDRRSGRVIQRSNERVDVATARRDDVAADLGASAERAALDPLAIALPPGGIPIAETDDRIIYETVEVDGDGAFERRFLHAATPGATAPSWTHLVGVHRMTPPPPPPP